MQDLRWRFTGLEFQMLWTRLGRDRLPYPLQFRPVAATRDDLDRQQRAAAGAVRARVTESLHHHLTVLADPDIRIEVAGFARSGTPARVRIHAGIRGDVGVLAVQGDRPDPDCGGDVRLTGLDSARLPAALVAALPAAPGGSRPSIRFRRSDVHSGSGSLMLPAGGTRLDEDARALLGRPRTGVGEISVFTGPVFDGRPTADGLGLHWLDIAGDGRYTLEEAGEITVAPATAADLAERIRRLTAAVRARRSAD